jgi:uncharacterized repeat protein (TIGR03803 family)
MAGGQTPEYELVYAFDGSSFFPGQMLQATDGNFYVAAKAGIFRIAPSCVVTLLHGFPSGAGTGNLIQAADGYLYGTIDAPFINDNSTIFKMDSAGNLRTIYTFPQYVEPDFPLVVTDDGNLYGFTGPDCTHFQCTPPPFPRCHCTQWAPSTAFKLDSAGNYSTIVTLSILSYPTALLQASDGNLYGTTIGDGACSLGTSFRIDTSGTFTTLHDFCGDPEGARPTSLIQSVDGNFYGTTGSGGVPNEGGTVFLMDTSGNVGTVYSFDSSTGGPQAVMQSSDGNLYGVTYSGGANGFGSIFRIDAAGNLTSLHDFDGNDGEDLSVAPIQTSDGKLWGTASDGGPLTLGVAYRLAAEGFGFNTVEPRSGPASGGDTVYFLGGGLLPGASATIGGLSAGTVSVSDPTWATGVTPKLSPGTLNDVTFTNPASVPRTSGTITAAFFADFSDVPQLDPLHDYVERIFRDGLTAGCGGGNYCPDDDVIRAQIAVLVLKGEHGGTYVPPTCSATVFADEPCPGGPFVDWVNQLASEGITRGCGGDDYCPGDSVTRAQMAVFLLKAENGSSYLPPMCTGIFTDVPCPSQFANWIEQLFNEHVTGGCSSVPLDYCPSSSVSRGQMAVFLSKTFNLP